MKFRGKRLIVWLAGGLTGLCTCAGVGLVSVALLVTSTPTATTTAADRPALPAPLDQLPTELPTDMELLATDVPTSPPEPTATAIPPSATQAPSRTPVPPTATFTWTPRPTATNTRAPTRPPPTQPPPPPPTQPPAPVQNCDPSYPDVCIPPYPPDLDCGQIPYRRFRVLPPDPHGFDGDNDGIGCER